MGSAVTDMKEEGTKKKTGRKYSVISAPGCTKPERVSEFKGKSLCIVFYPEKKLFTLGIKEFAAQREKFNEENCKVIACTADSSWATWSTSVGLTLKGEMAAANLDKIREEAFLPDPTSYEKQCIRHVMTTSLEPGDAVASALEAARIIKNYNLPDPLSCRRTTGGRDFQKKSFDRFKRASFYDLGLNTESGQIKYLGEAELLGQCHVPFVQSMMSSEGSQAY